MAADVAGLGGEFVEEKQAKGRSPGQDAIREFRRNKIAVSGLIFVVALFVVAIFAPVFTPYHYSTQNVGHNRAKPMTGYDITPDRLELCHWAGTPLEWGCAIYFLGSDALGRDMVSRVVYGARISLTVAVVASSVSLVIGIVYGTVSGFSGGAVDNAMMRIIDFLYAVPMLPLIILMTVFFKTAARAGTSEGIVGFLIKLDQAAGGLLFIFIAIGALGWLGLARLARGQVLSVKQKEFVEAAEALGGTNTRIIFKHLLPNIIGVLVIAESMAIPGYIFLESALSFIGLGVNPPVPSWGAMISTGYLGIKSNPHLVLVPGIALILTTLAFNFMGDGLRDAFDPRQRGKH